MKTLCVLTSRDQRAMILHVVCLILSSGLILSLIFLRFSFIWGGGVGGGGRAKSYFWRIVLSTQWTLAHDIIYGCLLFQQFNRLISIGYLSFPILDLRQQTYCTHLWFTCLKMYCTCWATSQSTPHWYLSGDIVKKYQQLFELIDKLTEMMTYNLDRTHGPQYDQLYQ